MRDVDEHERLVAEAADAASAEERLRLLTEAQGLWRGEPLDGVSTPGVAPERTRLCEQRLALLVARGEAELAAGHHRELVGLLASAVAEHPLAEQLAGLYMTALYRSSRQADALAAYELIRTRLAEELGTDTCPELQALHARILRGEGLADAGRSDPHTSPCPRSCRPPTGCSSAASRSWPSWPRRTTTSCSSRGRAGSARPPSSSPGRSGRRPTSRTASCSSTSVTARPTTCSPRRCPPSACRPRGCRGRPAERIGLYRTLTHDRRLLVVADDAGSVEQLLALVPSGPHARLVATTRRRLVMLSAHHDVREVLLRPLDAAASLALLGRVVGEKRLAREDATGLVAWCGGWPLLLRHAAATLALRPGQSMASLAEELAFGRPEPCRGRAVRGVRLAQAGRRDGCSSGSGCVTGEFCLHTAALAAGTTTHRVRLLLDELAGAHLVEEGGAGGFRYDAVVGRFARRLAAAHECTLEGWGLESAAPTAARLRRARTCRSSWRRVDSRRTPGRRTEGDVATTTPAGESPAGVVVMMVLCVRPSTSRTARRRRWRPACRRGRCGRSCRP